MPLLCHVYLVGKDRQDYRLGQTALFSSSIEAGLVQWHRQPQYLRITSLLQVVYTVGR